jgi:hypothetical protein
MHAKGSYGAQEARFAAPFAAALQLNPRFRRWVLEQTEFHPFAESASLLDGEMKTRRTKAATTWWRSHWRYGCDCAGCAGGQETDLLAVFGVPDGYRFALHIEVKQPKDRFPTDRDQAANYAARAQCWAISAPKSVVPHQAAATMLLCSRSKLTSYGPHPRKFGSVVTYEDVAAEFDNVFPAGIPS